MPISTVLVERVDSTDTAKPGCTRHLVTAKDWQQFVTLNDLRASLCAQAAKLGRPVTIAWKDGRRQQRDIVNVELTS